MTSDEHLRSQILDLARQLEPKLLWRKPVRRGGSLECYFSADLEVVVEAVDEQVMTSRNLAFIMRLGRGFPQIAPEFRVAPGSDKPFHPCFDHDGGWDSDFLPELPQTLAEWVVAFVRSLCFATRPVLSRERLLNRRAVEWYLIAREMHPELFPTDSLSFLDSVISSPSTASAGEPRRRLTIHPTAERTGGRKRFVIGEMTSPYRPREKLIPRDLCLEDGIKGNPRMSSRHFVTVQPAASRKLFDHIHWGERTFENQVEQGGILLGHVYRDSERNFVYGVVEDLVPGTEGRGSGTYLELSTEVWKTMLDYVDERLDRLGDNLQIIGWYHTHPNQLDVFMSGTDRSTQSRFFSEDWHFALVLNPHRQVLRGFHGTDATECNCNIIPAPEHMPTIQHVEKPDATQATHEIASVEGDVAEEALTENFLTDAVAAESTVQDEPRLDETRPNERRLNEPHPDEMTSNVAAASSTESAMGDPGLPSTVTASTAAANVAALGAMPASTSSVSAESPRRVVEERPQQSADSGAAELHDREAGDGSRGELFASEGQEPHRPDGSQSLRVEVDEEGISEAYWVFRFPKSPTRLGALLLVPLVVASCALQIFFFPQEAILNPSDLPPKEMATHPKKGRGLEASAALGSAEMAARSLAAASNEVDSTDQASVHDDIEAPIHVELAKPVDLFADPNNEQPLIQLTAGFSLERLGVDEQEGRVKVRVFREGWLAKAEVWPGETKTLSESSGSQEERKETEGGTLEEATQ